MELFGCRGRASFLCSLFYWLIWLSISEILSFQMKKREEKYLPFNKIHRKSNFHMLHPTFGSLFLQKNKKQLSAVFSAVHCDARKVVVQTCKVSSLVHGTWWFRQPKWVQNFFESARFPQINQAHHFTFSKVFIQ